MLFYITILLICQLIGEITVRALGLPVPGPVIGMLILFAGLVIRGNLPSGLESVANGFLSNLSLLFIPAGAGVTIYLGLLAQEWLPISASLIIGTALTIGISGWIMDRLLRRPTKRVS